MSFQRPSGSMVVACLALAVSLGGTATAARSLITGHDVKDRSLTGRDIRDGSMSSRQIRNRSLTGQQIRSGSLTGRQVRGRSLSGAQVWRGTLPLATLSQGSQDLIRQAGPRGPRGRSFASAAVGPQTTQVFASSRGAPATAPL